MKKILKILFIFSLINLIHSLLTHSYIVKDSIEPGECDKINGTYIFIVPGHSEGFEEDYQFTIELFEPKNYFADCIIYADGSNLTDNMVCYIDVGDFLLENKDIILKSNYNWPFNMIDWDKYMQGNYIIEKEETCTPIYSYEFIPIGEIIDRGCEMETHDRRFEIYGEFKEFYSSITNPLFSFNMKIYVENEGKSWANSKCEIRLTKELLYSMYCHVHDWGHISVKKKYPILENSKLRILIHKSKQEFFSDCKSDFMKISLSLIIYLVLLWAINI